MLFDVRVEDVGDHRTTHLVVGRCVQVLQNIAVQLRALHYLERHR